MDRKVESNTGSEMATLDLIILLILMLSSFCQHCRLNCHNFSFILEDFIMIRCEDSNTHKEVFATKEECGVLTQNKNGSIGQKKTEME